MFEGTREVGSLESTARTRKHSRTWSLACLNRGKKGQKAQQEQVTSNGSTQEYTNTHKTKRECALTCSHSVSFHVISSCRAFPGYLRYPCASETRRRPASQLPIYFRVRAGTSDSRGERHANALFLIARVCELSWFTSFDAACLLLLGLSGFFTPVETRQRPALQRFSGAHVGLESANRCRFAEHDTHTHHFRTPSLAPAKLHVRRPPCLHAIISPDEERKLTSSLARPAPP